MSLARSTILSANSTREPPPTTNGVVGFLRGTRQDFATVSGTTG